AHGWRRRRRPRATATVECRVAYSRASILAHRISGTSWGIAELRHHGGASTMTPPEVDTTPENADTTDDVSPKMFHYVRKDKIAESAVMGTHVVALCGEVFPVTKSPKPGSPVCPECKRIFESLPPGGED